jgi:hypothetical protein
LWAIPANIRIPLLDEVYKYANDTHLDTALRRIMTEISTFSEGFLMFQATSKGFEIHFANGYSISVMFDSGNYCNNYMRDIKGECKNAEVFIWHEGSTTEEPRGYQTPEQVAQLIHETSLLPAKEKK